MFKSRYIQRYDQIKKRFTQKKVIMDYKLLKIPNVGPILLVVAVALINRFFHGAQICTSQQARAVDMINRARELHTYALESTNPLRSYTFLVEARALVDMAHRQSDVNELAATLGINTIDFSSFIVKELMASKKLMLSHRPNLKSNSHFS